MILYGQLLVEGDETDELRLNFGGGVNRLGSELLDLTGGILAAVCLSIYGRLLVVRGAFETVSVSS